MTIPTPQTTAPDAGKAPPEETLYRSILVALDSSDHSNRGIEEAAAIAAMMGARVTGAHVYAAKLHDLRFRQMEGGLPERYREEEVLEEQRDVHDDLITRGLSIITDSFLDQAQRVCEGRAVAFTRRSLEGKNYRVLVDEANNGKYDLLVMGARGLGAVAGTRLGSVCERVTRRAQIDTLVIKEPRRPVAQGPILVGVDGSPHSYGGLLTALCLARRWKVPVQVVAAFDPYYHYVAFKNIAGVLSEEAGKVFRFEEQEKLHEELIDSGLAKIYQGHLTVAETIAKEQGMEIETVLLDGKPHATVEKHLDKVDPSLLVLGKLGIHADAQLDIGGNAEKLLRNVRCDVLLSQRQYRPKLDVVAETTTSWSREAETRMEKVPEFVRNMARLAILRYAQERGHTVITEKIVEEATAQLMPGHAERAMQEIVAASDAGELQRPAAAATMRWSSEASGLLLQVTDLALRGNLSMRAEKKARQERSATVEKRHISAFVDESSQRVGARQTEEPDARSAAESPPKPHRQPHWHAAALARLMRVPEGFMRDSSKDHIEDFAGRNGIDEITLEVAEQGLTEARKGMEEAMRQGKARGTSSPHPETPPVDSSPAETGVVWSREADVRLQSIPEGFSRDMTRKAAETIATRQGLHEIDSDFLDQILETFEAGARNAEETLPWLPEARARIERAPDMVRGMLIKEIEGWARRQGRERVDLAAVDAVKEEWQRRGVFHLDPEDPRGGL